MSRERADGSITYIVDMYIYMKFQYYNDMTEALENGA